MTANAVVVCSWGRDRGELPIGAEEVLTFSRKLSGPLGVDLAWLFLGRVPDQAIDVAARYGVARIERIGDPKVESFGPDTYVEALSQYCTHATPRVLLFSQTFDVRLVGPRLGGRLGVPVVMNGIDVEVQSDGRLHVTASAYGGDTRAVYEIAAVRPSILAVSANAVVPEPLGAAGSNPAVRDVAVDLSGVNERIRLVSRTQTQGPRLEDAQIIVAGGRGLGEQKHYRLIEDLAAALGGMAGASRPIVDDGWTDSAHQVGLTGRITRPALYIAAGISGASQHMVGCSAAKTLVAINRDPDAAVFRYARYGLVGDCLEILPELIRAVKQH